MAVRLADPRRRRYGAARPGPVRHSAPRLTHRGNPLEALSLDIARLLDRDTAAEMWGSLPARRTQGVHQASLYSGRPEGVRRSSAENIVPSATSSRRSIATSMSSSGCSMKSRATSAGRRRCAISSLRKAGWSIPCSLTPRAGWAKHRSHAQSKAEAFASAFFVSPEAPSPDPKARATLQGSDASELRADNPQRRPLASNLSRKDDAAKASLKRSRIPPAI